MVDRLRILHFGITQGLQDHANSIPLVRGKPTVIRVVPTIDHGPPVDDVSAVLKAFDANTQLAPHAGLQPDNGPITVYDSVWRADPARSLDFTLEPDWYSLPSLPEVRFEVELTLPQQVPQPLPKTEYLAKFVDRRPFNVRYVKVTGIGPNGGTPPRQGVTNQRACNLVRALWPVDPSLVTYESEGSTTMKLIDDGGNLIVNSADLVSLLNLQFLLAPSGTDALYGWVSEDCVLHNGLSDPVYFGGLGKVAFGNDVGADDIARMFPETWRYRRTLAHELGHNTHQDDYPDGVSINLPEPLKGLDHPPVYATSRRYYPRQLQDDEIGYDTLGIDPEQNLRSRTVVYARDDERMFDVMEAGLVEVDAWIGPYNYRKLFRCFEPAGTPVVSGGPRNGPTVYTVIQGVIRLPGEAAITRAVSIAVTNTNGERLTALAEATDEARSGEAELTVTLKNGGGVEEQIKIAWGPPIRRRRRESVGRMVRLGGRYQRAQLRQWRTRFSRHASRPTEGSPARR